MSLSSRFENIEMAQHLCFEAPRGPDVPEETRTDSDGSARPWPMPSARQRPGSRQAGASRDGRRRRHAFDLDSGRGPGVRSGRGRRPAGSGKPPEDVGAGHLLHEDVHGRGPLRPPRRRRDGNHFEKEPGRDKREGENPARRMSGGQRGRDRRAQGESTIGSGRRPVTRDDQQLVDSVQE